MKNITNLLFRGKDHVCPWWACFTFDNFIRKWFHDPAKILSPYVHPGETVVDIGPGMGYFSIPLAELVGGSGRVIAVDLQPRMLSALRKRAAGHGVEERIDTRLATPDSLGITAVADFVLAFWMVHEVPDQERFFEQVRRLLAPEGEFLVAEPVFHVRRRQFERTVAVARQAGLTLKMRPGIAFSMSAVFGL